MRRAPCRRYQWTIKKRVRETDRAQSRVRVRVWKEITREDEKKKYPGQVRRAASVDTRMCIYPNIIITAASTELMGFFIRLKRFSMKLHRTRYTYVCTYRRTIMYNIYNVTSAHKSNNILFDPRLLWTDNHTPELRLSRRRIRTRVLHDIINSSVNISTA